MLAHHEGRKAEDVRVMLLRAEVPEETVRQVLAEATTFGSSTIDRPNSRLKIRVSLVSDDSSSFIAYNVDVEAPE